MINQLVVVLVDSILGSGRDNAMIQNQAQWGYGPNNLYKAPDTSGNAGQYHNI